MGLKQCEVGCRQRIQDGVVWPASLTPEELCSSRRRPSRRHGGLSNEQTSRYVRRPPQSHPPASLAPRTVCRQETAHRAGTSGDASTGGSGRVPCSVRAASYARTYARHARDLELSIICRHAGRSGGRTWHRSIHTTVPSGWIPVRPGDDRRHCLALIVMIDGVVVGALHSLTAARPLAGSPQGSARGCELVLDRITRCGLSSDPR